MDERTLDRLDYLKSQIISDVKNLDFEDGMSIRLRVGLSKEMDRLIDAEIARPIPTPTPEPEPEPEPEPRIVAAPAAVAITIPYGSVNMRADGVVTWTNGNGTQTDGTLAEIFAIDGKVWGRTAGNATYTSLDTVHNWAFIDNWTAYIDAWNRATKIIQTANCPPLPDLGV